MIIQLMLKQRFYVWPSPFVSIRRVFLVFVSLLFASKNNCWDIVIAFYIRYPKLDPQTIIVIGRSPTNW